MNSYAEGKQRFYRTPEDAPDFQLFDRMFSELTFVLNNDQDDHTSFLKELAEFQATDGTFRFVDGVNIPSDARVDFIYMPTYMGAAIFMREYLNPSKKLPINFIKNVLEQALKFSLGRGLRGHGFEAEAGLQTALNIFQKGGLRCFLETSMDVCPEFHQMIWKILDKPINFVSQWGTPTSDEAFNLNMKELFRKIKPQKRLYLAYGSNIPTERMLERCPRAKLVGKTFIDNWKLCFHYFANIEPCEGAITPAVVWEVSNADERALDKFEGFPKHYYKENILVTINGKRVSTMVYVMTGWKKKHDSRANLAPATSYVALIKRGYSEHGFFEILKM